MHTLHPSLRVMTALLPPAGSMRTGPAGKPERLGRRQSARDSRSSPRHSRLGTIPSSSGPASLSIPGFPDIPLPSPRGLTASEFLLAAFGVPAVALRGRLGDRVFKTYGDRIVITRVPRFDGYVPSAAQRDRRAKMRDATAYAQAVYANPAAKAVYVAAARELGRQPFRLAVSDFLRGRTRVAVAVEGLNQPRQTTARVAPARSPERISNVVPARVARPPHGEREAHPNAHGRKDSTSLRSRNDRDRHGKKNSEGSGVVPKGPSRRYGGEGLVFPRLDSRRIGTAESAPWHTAAAVRYALINGVALARSRVAMVVNITHPVRANRIPHAGARAGKRLPH